MGRSVGNVAPVESIPHFTALAAADAKAMSEQKGRESRSQTTSYEKAIAREIIDQLSHFGVVTNRPYRLAESCNVA